MASTKEIQNRINSIQDTMKITNAMYMMSSMKLRKAKKKINKAVGREAATKDESDNLEDL